MRDEVFMSVRPAKSAFVAMPFAAQFDPLYRNGIMAAAADVGLALNKLGRLPVDEIVARMEAEIGRSDFVVSVATGRNPHVFCEIGLAHATRKPCIIMAEQESDFEIFRKLHCCLVYGRDLSQLRDQLRVEFSRLMTM